MAFFAIAALGEAVCELEVIAGTPRQLRVTNGTDRWVVFKLHNPAQLRVARCVAAPGGTNTNAVPLLVRNNCQTPVDAFGTLEIEAGWQLSANLLPFGRHESEIA